MSHTRNSVKIRNVRAALFHVEKRTDGQMTRLILSFRYWFCDSI